MRCAMSAIFLLLATSTITCAETKIATFYSDGAVVEVEASAVKGFVESSIPAGVIGESVRVFPLGSSVIRQVDIVSTRSEVKGNADYGNLLERKSRLEDRLKALETREAIFKAAAKSQSAKAPRKTKANPDPVQSMRQGTEFAISQLEAVYTARRKAEQEIRQIEGRLAKWQKGENLERSVARVAVTPPNGKVRVRYALPGAGWTPRYDLRLEEGTAARLTLFGQLPALFVGYQLRATSGAMSEALAQRSVAAFPGMPVKLAEYALSVRDGSFADSIRTSYTFTLDNSSGANLVAGDASLYRKGEYWGRFRFEGISSNRSRKVVSGR